MLGARRRGRSVGSLQRRRRRRHGARGQAAVAVAAHACNWLWRLEARVEALERKAREQRCENIVARKQNGITKREQRQPPHVDHLVGEHAPELCGNGGRHERALAPEFKVEWEKDGLEEGQDDGEDGHPHLDKARDEAVVGHVAKRLVERAKARQEQVVDVINQHARHALLDAALHMHLDQRVEVFNRRVAALRPRRRAEAAL